MKYKCRDGYGVMNACLTVFILVLSSSCTYPSFAFLLLGVSIRGTSVKKGESVISGVTYTLAVLFSHCFTWHLRCMCLLL
jgi:hypothetical protein